VIRLEEGKMVEDRVEVDQLGMMQQLSAVASPQQAGGLIFPAYRGEDTAVGACAGGEAFRNVL
jgi:hypothetical protein